jgi:hypothetical protein
MSALAFHPTKGPREGIVGYFTFITAAEDPPVTSETATGGFEEVGTMLASFDPLGIVRSLARTGVGTFRAVLNGEFSEVYAQAQAHAATLNSAVVSATGNVSGNSFIDITVRDNLGAAADTSEVTVGVSFMLLLDAKTITRP